MPSHRVPLPEALVDPSHPDFVSAAGAYVRRVHRAYDVRARWHRRLYRLSGIVVIVTGASLPLLTTVGLPYRDLTISLVGTLVSAVTALRAFYRWDQAWALLRIAEFEITGAYWEWFAIVQDGAGFANETTSLAYQEATARMLERVGEIRRNEATSYFKDLPAPDGIARATSPSAS